MKTFSWMRYPALFVVLLLSALQLQALPISSCTSTFNASVPFATFNVTANLFGPSNGSCINVTAPNITINLNKFVLTGKGGNTIGINISTAATGVHINGLGKITGFGTGIQDQGDSAVLKFLKVVENTQTGVLMDTVGGSSLLGSWVVLNGANGVVLKDTKKCMVGHNASIAGNGNGTQGYGVWIQNSGKPLLSVKNTVMTNIMDNTSFPGTQVAGIWVGSSDNALLSGCAIGTPSSGNLISDNRVDANVTAGIGLECGAASSTTVTGNEASLNTFDGADGNPACGSDSWSSNSFTTKFRSCD